MEKKKVIRPRATEIVKVNHSPRAGLSDGKRSIRYNGGVIVMTPKIISEPQSPSH